MTNLLLKTTEDELLIPAERVGVLSSTGQSQGLTTDLSLLVDGDTVATLIDVVDRPPAIIRDRNPDAQDTARDAARGAQTVVVDTPESIELDSGVYGVDGWTVEQDERRNGKQQYRVTLQLVSLRALFTFSRVQFTVLPRSDATTRTLPDGRVSFTLSPRSFVEQIAFISRVQFTVLPRSDATIRTLPDGTVSYIVVCRIDDGSYGTEYGNKYGEKGYAVTRTGTYGHDYGANYGEG